MDRAHSRNDKTAAPLEENIGAVAPSPKPEDLREIDDAASMITVHGDRYPEELEKMAGR